MAGTDLLFVDIRTGEQCLSFFFVQTGSIPEAAFTGLTEDECGTCGKRFHEFVCFRNDCVIYVMIVG